MAADLRAALDAWLAGRVVPPIARFVGIRILSAAEGKAEMELPVRAELHNHMGTLHGGVFADLADAAMGAAVASLTGHPGSFATVDLHLRYFVPVREGTLRAAAEVIRDGHATAYCECSIYDQKGTLAAKAGSTVVFQGSAQY